MMCAELRARPPAMGYQPRLATSPEYAAGLMRPARNKSCWCNVAPEVAPSEPELVVPLSIDV